MKVMPAHRARMVDAGSALVVSGRRQNRMEPWLARDGRADQDGQVPRQRGLGQGEPRRPKAQESPFDPIPSEGDDQSPFFLLARQLSLAIFVIPSSQNLAPERGLMPPVSLSHIPTVRVRHLPYHT